jgi:hypothetical protein
MKLSKHRGNLEQDLTPPLQLPAATREAQSLAALVASAFTRLRIAERVRVLRCLLQPVGPMALAVLGGGVFAKYIAQARWPRMSISLDDAARVTAGQVYELVRYIEQSHPLAIQQALAVLARDATTMAALGGSVAAIVMQHLANRSAARPANSPSDGAQPSLRDRRQP